MGYLTNARTAAVRPRSRWNLLLIPCYTLPWLLLTFVSLIGLGRAYAFIHAIDRVRVLPDTVGGILMAVGTLFAWLGPTMIAANLMVSLVPPARRALDREAASLAGADCAAANRALRKLSRYLIPAGVVVVVIGLIIPW